MPTQPHADRCWWLPRHPPVFIVLGRYGDLILLLPAFRAIYQRTSIKPIVLVSQDYASVLEGVSYVVPEVVRDSWWEGMPQARRQAERKYACTIVPQWWDDPETAGDMVVDLREKGARVLQSHGREWGVDCNANPDFGTSMWRRAGFTREEMLTLPLVFDRRDPGREDELARRYVTPGRPLLLFNFLGMSSPFGFVPEMMHVLNGFKATFQCLDLGTVKARRIYDLLGLYDRAAGLITIDTATCHLAPGSMVPTIWLTVPGWGRSVPRGNVALHVQYDQVPARLAEIGETIGEWAVQAGARR